MVKSSLLLMLVFTVLCAMALRWREGRTGKPMPAPAGWLNRQKKAANRWVTAAALAAVVTLVLLGGLQWLRVWQG